jgi:hypothetical protein
MTERYFARSANDKTNDWPFWFVADRSIGGLNVTAELIRKHINPSHAGGTISSQDMALELAEIANAGGRQ